VTFHKAKEESKWKQWKEQEERILRKSGVSEEVIQRLRELDWQDFNAERRFWEHFSSNQEELYTRELEEPSSVVLNIQQLLDSVENEQLLQVLLEILLLKMWGFSVHEIAGQMGLPEKTIYTRIERLKKKIKKVLKK
jgi:DNA-directed RNA polymerase specialized sigma24 family protein